MPSRRELDDRLARHPVVGAEPRIDIYGRIGIHPDRLTPKALPMEFRVWAKSLLRADRPRPFLIYGRPRSGTTLLVHLLDQVPGVRCDGELLHHFLIDPVGFLKRLPSRAGPDLGAYGMKLISYHLMEIQRIRRPLAFFDRIGDYGYRVIHLTRDSWDQTLSLVKAQRSGVYFNKSGTKGPSIVTIDPELFLRTLRWNVAMLDYENTVMSHVDHCRVHYDDDLKQADRHQETVDRVCDFLGVPSGPVASNMTRTGGKGGTQKVENIDQIIARVRDSDLADYVPERR